MFKMLVAVFLFLNATQAFGVGRSEEWFQAEKGEMFSELNFGYLDTDYDAGGADTNYNSKDVHLSFEMGLSENASWFSNVGYFMADGAADFEGTRALTTGIRLQHRLQNGRFTAMFKASHELESFSADNQNGAVFALAVGGGYEHFFDKELVGVFAQMPFLTSDFEGAAGEAIRAKGVPKLSLYAETHRISSLVIGLKIDYSLSGDNLQKEYRIDRGFRSNSGKFQVAEGSLYARYDLDTKWSVLANGGYIMSTSEGDTDIDGITGFQGGLGARYKF